MLWQVVKYDVSNDISIVNHPELKELKNDEESATHFNNVAPLVLFNIFERIY